MAWLGSGGRTSIGITFAGGSLIFGGVSKDFLQARSARLLSPLWSQKILHGDDVQGICRSYRIVFPHHDDDIFSNRDEILMRHTEPLAAGEFEDKKFESVG